MASEDVLFVSVPERERDYVAERLPGAAVTAKRLSYAVANEHPDVRVLSLMVHDPVDTDVLSGFGRLEAVVTRSAGFDHLPLDWFRGAGVAAYALGGYSTTSVAHLTIGLILGLLYRVPEAMAQTQGFFRGGSGGPGWDRSELTGRHLHDVTVGVVGTGRIGGEVVRIVHALGGRSLGYDIAPSPDVAGTPGFQYVARLDELLGGSDVVSLHVPLTERTVRMIGEAALGRMRDRSLLVNTCRGEVVDQAAVERALRDGRLAGYAADTMPDEPAPPDLKRFADLPNVVFTPHLAAYNTYTIGRRYETTARIVRAILEERQQDVAEFRVA